MKTINQVKVIKVSKAKFMVLSEQINYANKRL
jgi:hypothetical protein